MFTVVVAQITFWVQGRWSPAVMTTAGSHWEVDSMDEDDQVPKINMPEGLLPPTRLFALIFGAIG